jgi:hypothetical protein
MIRKVGGAVVLLLLFGSTFAQVDSVGGKSVHYIGVQANQLIRQIFNFSNSNVAVNNPYLLTYSVNSGRSGHGLNIGLGYFLSELKDGDLMNKRETSISNLSFRVGWERKRTFGRNWITSYGVDITLARNNNETTNSTDTEFNKSKITTKSSVNGTGFGPRVTLNYMFSPKLMVGTEVNYYFTRQKNSLDITSSITTQQWDPFTQQMVMVTTTDSDETEDKTKRFELSPPVAIFLIMKL